MTAEIRFAEQPPTNTTQKQHNNTTAATKNINAYEKYKEGSHQPPRYEDSKLASKKVKQKTIRIKQLKQVCIVKLVKNFIEILT